MNVPENAQKHPVYNLWAKDDGSVYGPRGLRKPQKDRYGYLRVSFLHMGKHKKRSVHQVVAECFMGLTDKTVNHKNSNKEDNRACKLEHVTSAENVRLAFRAGLNKICKPVFVDGHYYYSKRECERVTGIPRNKLENIQ